MNAATKVPSNAAIGNSVNTLREISSAEKNIAVYERSIVELQPEVDRLVSREFSFRKSGSVSEIECELVVQTSASNISALNIISDITEILGFFGEITGTDSFRLSLETINTNMCRRFHTDLNDIRLLCTYSGPGTLWLPENNVNRKVLASRDESEAVFYDAGAIQQASAGDILLLKGALYPVANTSAIVHRSPTIEESGERRLLLRIDTNEFLSF